MSTKRLWLIAGGAAALVAIIVLVLMLVPPPSSDVEPTPRPSATSTPTSTPSPAASATPTPTPTSPAVATCESTSTAEFRSMMAGNGWVSWETQDQAIGARPFDVFPNGSPDGAIVCRWGESPDLATDNVIDLAWTPIGGEDAVAAMDKLGAEGFTRIDTTDGVFLAMQGPPGYTDAEGWGETYLFGFDDVRWATTKAAATNYVKAPDEVG